MHDARFPRRSGREDLSAFRLRGVHAFHAIYPTAVAKIGKKIGKSMFKVLVRCALCLLAFLPAASAAEPIKLKLSFFSSDRSTTYLLAIKPFVDAVNADSERLIEIEVYFSGALGRLQAQQPQLVDDGVAD